MKYLGIDLGGINVAAAVVDEAGTILSRGKIAILMGSFASAVLGTVLIFLFSKKKTRI